MNKSILYDSCCLWGSSCAQAIDETVILTTLIQWPKFSLIDDVIDIFIDHTEY